MKKFFVLILFFLSMNGLHAMEEGGEPIFGSPAAFALRLWCDAQGGESYARLLERGAERELTEVRRVREWHETGRAPFVGYIYTIGSVPLIDYIAPLISCIIRDCFARQDRALRILRLLQEAGYQSEAQRR